MLFKSRQIFVLLTALVLVAAVFGSAGAKTSILVTICCGQQDRLDWINETAEAYMQLNPDIEVQTLDAGKAKVDTMVASGAGPDLIWTGQSWGAQAAYFTPLNEFLKKDPTFTNDLIPAMLQAFAFGGNYYAIPFAAAPRAMAYNADMLQSLGYARPKASWTWTDAINIALKATKDSDGDGMPNTWGVGLYWWPWDFMGYGDPIFKNNGRDANIDQPVIRAAVDLFMDIYSGRRYKVMPTDYVGYSGASPTEVFAAGSMAMLSVGVFDLPNLLASLRQDWDIQEFPLFQWGGDLRKGGSWSAEGYALWNGSKNASEALRFLRFMLDRENTARLARQGGILPASRWAVSEAYLKIKKPANMAALVNGIEYQMSTSSHMAWSNISALMWNPIWNTSQGHNGQVPTAMLLEESQRLMQQALDDYFSKVNL